MKKRKILMLILLVSTVLLSGCGKTFLSRLFKSEHEEYAENSYGFFGCGKSK